MLCPYSKSVNAHRLRLEICQGRSGYFLHLDSECCKVACPLPVSVTIALQMVPPDGAGDGFGCFCHVLLIASYILPSVRRGQRAAKREAVRRPRRSWHAHRFTMLYHLSSREGLQQPACDFLKLAPTWAVPVLIDTGVCSFLR